MIKPRSEHLKLGPLPPSCLGPDGKFRPETDKDRQKRLESARRRLREIAEILIEDFIGLVDDGVKPWPYTQDAGVRIHHRLILRTG